jgi:hypothetical protein
LGTLYFKDMGDVLKYDKKGEADESRFTIKMMTGDGGPQSKEKEYKFKAATDEEGQEWFDLLTEWREYVVLH